MGLNGFGKGKSCTILVLGDDLNFGTYTGEILKAEGFNEFNIESLSFLKKSSHLRNYDLVILSESIVNSTQIKQLNQYVRGGGNLIVFKPGKSLAAALDVEKTDQNISEGYIRIDSSTAIGKGLESATIQYHGQASLYKANNSEKIADLYLNSKDPSGFAALMLSSLGKGFCAVFSYNLPQSIVYTRQGNPDWAGEERDKVDGPTATDLFFPLKDQVQWNDPNKIAIPQADEQMRLLTHVIEYMNQQKRPLPRFWYFPDTYKSIFIFTIDGEDSKEMDIDKEIQEVQSKNGNATLYEIGTYIRPEMVERWRKSGNEVAIHFNDVPNYSNPTFTNMNTVLDTMTSNFRRVYGYNPVSTRHHWVVWVSKDSTGKKEFVQQAAMEADHGIGMDCNYYQFGGNKVYPNWIGDVGHFNGSGIPMKFAKLNGKILNIYQSNTQLPDETWLKENIENKSKTLIDRSLDQEQYAWINANYHTWYWKECREPGLRVLDYCNQRNVPIWTAEKAYYFLKAKDEAAFDQIKWKKNELSFEVKSNVKHQNNITVMVPLKVGKLKVKSVNGGMAFNIWKVKGTDYALISVQTGQSSHIKICYN
jgi:hypothetical protein